MDFRSVFARAKLMDQGPIVNIPGAFEQLAVNVKASRLQDLPSNVLLVESAVHMSIC